MIDILKLKAFPAAGLLFMVFALLSGIIFIFVFNIDLFFKLNIIQLILLSVCGTAPLIVLNSIIVLININCDIELDSSEDINIGMRYSGTILFSSIWTMLVVYIPILAHVVVKLSFSYGFMISMIIEFIIIAIIYFDTRTALKESKSN